ncbi:MAG: tetratricopeptide repeat protein, partial [Candidatus Omnitrophica bacterium]|nr:tetratricopeptide repeat protein [Candidatus Omnitrophota bacterium]
MKIIYRKKLIRSVVLLIFIFSAFWVNTGQGEVLSPEDQARWGMAVSYNNLNEFEKALTILDMLYEQYPESVDVEMEFIRTARALKKYESIIKILKQRIQ